MQFISMEDNNSDRRDKPSQEFQVLLGSEAPLHERSPCAALAGSRRNHPSPPPRQFWQFFAFPGEVIWSCSLFTLTETSVSHIYSLIR